MAQAFGDIRRLAIHNVKSVKFDREIFPSRDKAGRFATLNILIEAKSGKFELVLFASDATQLNLQPIKPPSKPEVA